jgi:hypothetical protein
MLAPGKYTIKQISSASNPSVLEFLTDDGTKLATTITAIPLLQNTPPSSTRIVLESRGGTSHLSKIWVEGEDYGYEFPADPFRSTQVASTTMQLRYEGAAVVAQAAPAPAAPEPAPIAQAPAPAPVENREPELIAQNTPAPRPDVAEPQPAPQVQTAPQVAQTETTETLPATAMGWMDILGAGLACFGTAIALRIARSREAL